MKREAIRQLIADAMAERGFSRGRYWWSGCELQIMPDGVMGKRLAPMRLPSGTSKKRLLEFIATLPNVGPALVAPQFAKADRMRQTDISEFTGEGRR